MYRPPEILRGVNLNDISPEMAEQCAQPWIRTVHFIWPNEADHIIKYLAHCVQKPHIKINHLLMLAGPPGIGKDEILAPVRHAIGPWNFTEATPEQVMGLFTEYQKGVIARINEARDLGDADGHKFYNRLKWIAAAPPEVRKINEKHLRPYYTPNVGGVIVTSNHRTGSIFPEPDDRRVFATWSDKRPADFPTYRPHDGQEKSYFDVLGYWYEHGSLPGEPDGPWSGFKYVAAYLNRLDISSFNPYAPPRKTLAFYDLLSPGLVTPEAIALSTLLEDMKNPVVVTFDVVKTMAIVDQIRYPGLSIWLTERKNWNAIPYKFEQCGYVRVHNPRRVSDGLWKIDGRPQVVYGRKDASELRVKAVEFLAASSPEAKGAVLSDITQQPVQTVTIMAGSGSVRTAVGTATELEGGTRLALVG